MTKEEINANKDLFLTAQQTLPNLVEHLADLKQRADKRERLDYQRTKGENRKRKITCISRYEHWNFNDDLRHRNSQYWRYLL